MYSYRRDSFMSHSTCLRQREIFLPNSCLLPYMISFLTFVAIFSCLLVLPLNLPSTEVLILPQVVALEGQIN